MYAYNVGRQKKTKIVKITKEKKLKNGAVMIMGIDTYGDKVCTIVAGK